MAPRACQLKGTSTFKGKYMVLGMGQRSNSQYFVVVKAKSKMHLLILPLAKIAAPVSKEGEGVSRETSPDSASDPGLWCREKEVAKGTAKAQGTQIVPKPDSCLWSDFLGGTIKIYFLECQVAHGREEHCLWVACVGSRALMEGRQVPWVSARTAEYWAQGNRILCMSLWHASGAPLPTEQVF